MKKLVIILFTLLLLTSCGQETIASPVREEIKTTATNLGAKKSDSKPVILINDGEDTLYIGETDFEFDVEVYSDNGEVTISFDDSAVDFNTANSYQIKILASDNYNSNEDNGNLTMKVKPAPNLASSSSMGNSLGGSGSSGASGCYRTCLGVFCSWEDFLAYVDKVHAMGGLSDSNWEDAHSYSSLEEAGAERIS